jgi:hypothetical protein
MQNTVVTPTDLKTALVEIRQAAAELYRFTEKLTLLKMVHHVAIQVIKSVDNLQKELKKPLTGADLFVALESSKSVLFLEEVVDADTMSDLEDYILSFTKKLDDEDLTQFLSEVMDKVETKYNSMLEKTHEFNSLIKDELE